MTGKIALFIADKGENTKRPDFRGKGEIEGVSVRCSAWWNTATKTGEKYLSIVVEEETGEWKGKSKTPEGQKSQDAAKASGASTYGDNTTPANASQADERVVIPPVEQLHDQQPNDGDDIPF
jgi:hypothetical protein